MLGVISFYDGNYRSICNSLEKRSIPHCLIGQKNLDDLEKSNGFVLPGVGNASSCLAKFQNTDTGRRILEKLIIKKTCVLGICVGAQVLLSASIETETNKGLGLVKGNTESLYKNKKVEVGFKRIQVIDHPLFKNISEEMLFYFDHAFAANIKDDGIFLSKTKCKKKLCCCFHKG